MQFRHAVHNHRRLLITLGVLLLLYILLGFLLLPWLAQRQLVNTLQDRLQIATAIDDIRFNPFTFTGSIDNLHLRTAEDYPLLDLRQLYFNFEPSRLFLMKVRLDELSFTTPQLYINRFSETDNTISRLAGRWEASAEPAQDGSGAEQPDTAPSPDEQGGAAQEETDLFPLEVGRFAYTEGSVHFHDEVPESDFDTVMNPINILVENFSTIEEEEPGNNELLIALEQDARLRLNSNFIVSPLQLQGHVALENFSLLTPYRYYQDTAPFVLEDGRLGISMDYDLTLPVGGLNMLVSNIQVQLSDIIAREGDMAPFIEGGALTLSNGRISYPDIVLEADTLELADTTLRIVQNRDGELNLLRMLAAIGDDTEDETEADDDEDSSLQLNLGQFTVSDTAIEFTDEAPSEPARFGLNLNASLQEFNLVPDRQMPFTVDTTLTAGGELALSGGLQLFPDLDLQSDLTLTGLVLQPLQPYLSEQARVTISGGELNANARLLSNENEALSWEGDISLAGLQLNDQLREEPLLGWGNLALDDVAVSVTDRRLAVSEIVFDRLYSRIVITEEGETNVGLVLNDAPPELAEEAAEAADDIEEVSEEEPQTGEEFTISVGRVAFNEASSDFMDQNLPIVFDARMQTLNGELSGFSTDSAQPMQLALEGQVDEFGLVEIDGSLNPLDITSRTTINLNFTNLDLPATSPYVIKFAGREIAEGSADLDLQYQVNGGELNASNQIVIRDIQLGDRVESPDALDLPLDMAVALLKSSEGIIELEIPVSGDVNDPRFSLGPIIRGAISNAIGNIVTSPFRFLGSLVGGNGQEISSIGFRPGRTDIAPPEQQKLQRLAAALQQRPQLLLQLPAPLAAEEDRQALQASVVDARIEEGLTQQVSQDAEQPEQARQATAGSGNGFSDQRLQVLERLYEEAQLSPPLEELRLQFTAIPEPAEQDADADGDDARDGDAESPVEASLLAVLTFDLLAYSEHLRQMLIKAEDVSDLQLRTLAEQRQQAALDYLLANSGLDSSRLQPGDLAEAETEDGWVSMEFELSPL